MNECHQMNDILNMDDSFNVIRLWLILSFDLKKVRFTIC